MIRKYILSRSKVFVDDYVNPALSALSLSGVIYAFESIAVKGVIAIIVLPIIYAFKEFSEKNNFKGLLLSCYFVALFALIKILSYFPSLIWLEGIFLIMFLVVSWELFQAYHRSKNRDFTNVKQFWVFLSVVFIVSLFDKDFKFIGLEFYTKQTNWRLANVIPFGLGLLILITALVKKYIRKEK